MLMRFKSSKAYSKLEYNRYYKIPMRIDEMHHCFRLELDRVDSSCSPDLEPWEIDSYLNKAIMKFLKDRYGIDIQNPRKGFETDQSRISQLSSLHIKAPSVQGAIFPVNEVEGIYEVRLNDLGKDVGGQYFRYMFFTDGYVKATKGNCTKCIPIDVKRVDKKSTEYNDSSWLWRRIVVNFGRSSYQHPHVDNTVNDPDTTADLEPGNRYNNDESNSIYLDTRDKYCEPQFEIDEVFLSYIKYPNRVFIGGYDHIDGMSTNIDGPIHCDIDDAFHEEIVSIAVRMAEEDIQDVTGVKIHNQRLQA